MGFCFRRSAPQVFSPFTVNISDVEKKIISAAEWKKISNAYSESEYQVNWNRTDRILAVGTQREKKKKLSHLLENTIHLTKSFFVLECQKINSPDFRSFHHLQEEVEKIEWVDVSDPRKSRNNDVITVSHTERPSRF